MKNTIIILLIIVAIVGGYFLLSKPFSVNLNTDQDGVSNIDQNQDSEPTTNTDVEEKDNVESILGKSAGGRDIPVFQYGKGHINILFVGGVHGGYAWNTSLLAYETIDYLRENPEIIPENIAVTIIPTLNPDGLSKVTGESTLANLSNNPPSLADTITGRFNGNSVDLNRNFDCDWQPEGIWQNKTVSGGEAVFSEPESQALKNYIENENPTAVVVWYSSAGGVFSSDCHNGISSETKNLTNTYANASGYPAYDEFSSYEINGDLVNWLAKKNIPAISVLLTDHNNIEWTKNKAGIEAVLNSFTE